MLGCDVEQFLFKNNVILPAEKTLPGHKYEPFHLGGNCSGHPDNIMAEIALVDPVAVENFSEQVSAAVDILKAYVGKDIDVMPIPTVMVPKDILSTSTCANEIGCDPDMDADGNEYRYNAKQLGTYRFAGFHIHFDVNPMIDNFHAAQICDCTIGIASIANGWDSNQGERRKFYGTPGRHRPKHYGIEYRMLSPAMLNHLDGLQEILNIVAPQLEAGDGPCIPLPYMYSEAVAQAIREEDVSMARALWDTIRAQIS